jgi:4-hydroxybenzoate polyprenyltransferase
MNSKIFFNSITISLPKNVIQFLLGIILYWLIIGMPNTYTTLFALASFIITYSSVYLFNDIFDHKEDVSDKEKLKWKLIASGRLNKNTAWAITAMFIICGLSMSILVGRWFFLMMVALLSLNFLHSSPRTRLKKRIYATSVNMTVIEFLKYSCGWFALTTNIAKFPFWLMLAFSLVYTASYIIYKFKFKGHIIRSNRKLFIGFGVVGVVSYIISFILYGFPLSMILLVAIPIGILLLLKYMDVKVHRISNMLVIEYLLLPVVILSFVMLTIPFIDHTNDMIARNIINYTETIKERMPPDIIRPLKNISDKLEEYETLEDIEKNINKSIGNITRPII